MGEKIPLKRTDWNKQTNKPTFYKTSLIADKLQLFLFEQ
jgi:hypothetical protein